MPSRGSSTTRRVELHLGASADAAWEHVVRPWFEKVSRAGSSAKRPTLVVLPYQSRAQLYRQRLVDARISLLGVEFLTPPQLRDILLRSTGIKLPLREHLRLLLSVAAEQFLAIGESTGHSESMLAAKAVLREPDHLLRTIDELNGAGWPFAEVGPKAFRTIVEKYESLVHECGFTPVQHADRQAGDRAENDHIPFENVLIAGFDGAHWSFWPLLSATVQSAAHATIVLTDPRDEARDLDECWVGSWEQLYGESRIIDPVSSRKASAFPSEGASAPKSQLELFEPDPIRGRSAELHFLLGQETTGQAQAIAALTLQFLAQPECQRIGVLFPEAGALARTVSTVLTGLNIPHFDSIGHLIAPTLEDVSWLAWLDLQENNRLRPLLQFLSTLDRETAWLGEIKLNQIENVLRRAYSQILIDDISVLREFCAHHSEREEGPAVARAVAAVQFLPLNATPATFTAQSRRIFEDLGWTHRKAELERLSRDWVEAIDFPITRASYLRWLGEILGKPTRSRDDMGDHPYSRVYLLSLPEAEGQEWSHLIMAGLNEGAWPPPNDESDFVRDAEIETLNQQIRVLNRKATVRGRHGEGQWSVTKGKALCLGAREQRDLAKRQMANLMESARHSVGITAALFTESVPRRIANPSEFFTRLYFECHASALSQTTLEAMEAQTRTWVRAFGFEGAESRNPEQIEQTKVAYAARRTEAKAGEWEFALHTPPSEAISLSASEFERFFKSPALIWMKTFLGVQSDDQDVEQWSLALGNWVHQWLRHIVPPGSPHSFSKVTDDLPARVRRSAISFREEIIGLLQESDHALPDWWTSTWNNASYIADTFAALVTSLSEWRYATTEWSLRALPPIRLNDTSALKLRGRIDLTLAKAPAKLNQFAGADLWVIDYKTGKRKSLRSSQWRSETDVRKGVLKQLRKGDGIQVALYALALRQLDAGDIGMSLLARGLDLSAPQLQLSDVIVHEGFWDELARVQRNGVFGMRGAIRSEFSFSGAYPLATLAVDYDLLEAKWALTHPAFAGESSETDV